MKSKLKMIRNIIFWMGLYLLMQVVCNIGFSIFYAISHLDSISKNHAEEFGKQFANSIMQYQFGILLLSAILCFLIYYLALKNKKEDFFTRCCFNKFSLNNVPKIIIAAIGLSFFTMVLAEFLYPYFPGYKDTAKMFANSKDSLLSLLCVTIFIPIFEEILFRGLVFKDLRRNLNIYLAIFLQAILFALFHMQPLQIIYVFPFALALGIIFCLTKSIYSTMIVHIIFNILGISGLLTLLPQNTYLHLSIGAIGLVVCIATLIFMSKSNNRNAVASL